jgi:hypothetical protein
MHNLDRTQVGFGQEAGNYEMSSGETPLNESEQVELAAELLEVSSEAELDQFIGDFISKAGSALGKFVRSDTGQALTGALKTVAKQVLPMAGQAVGGYFGGPTGSQIGGQLASAASNLFEAENEDQEWEAANTFVKLATDAVKTAVQAPPGANARAVAQNAVLQAAQTHAPGLLTAGAGAGGGAGQQPGTGGNGTHAADGGGGHKTGRWFRRGNRIVLMGA